MLSIPPAITISASPQRIAWAAMVTLFKPEPQSLLTVSAGTLLGRPALMADCLAGFCPQPAVSTWPRITSSTLAGSRPVFQEGANHDAAQFDGTDRCQATLKGADGGAGCGYDDDVLHD